MHREPDVGFDPGSPGSRPGPKAGAKPLRHPGIPILHIFISQYIKNQQFTLIFPIPVQSSITNTLIFSISIFVSPLSSTKNIFANVTTSSECNPSSVTRVAPHPPCKHTLAPGLASDRHLFQPPSSEDCSSHLSLSLTAHNKLLASSPLVWIITYIELQHHTLSCPPSNTHSPHGFLSSSVSSQGFRAKL